MAKNLNIRISSAVHCAVTIVTMLLLVGWVTSCGKKDESKESVIKTLTKADDFDKILKENPVVLVDFYADWCGPCHMLKPTIDEVARDYSEKVRVVAIDVDKFESLGRQYEITSIPAIKIFKNSIVDSTLLGVQSKEAYTAVLDRLVTD